MWGFKLDLSSRLSREAQWHRVGRKLGWLSESCHCNNTIDSLSIENQYGGGSETSGSERIIGLKYITVGFYGRSPLRCKDRNADLNQDENDGENAESGVKACRRKKRAVEAVGTLSHFSHKPTLHVRVREVGKDGCGVDTRERFMVRVDLAQSVVRGDLWDTTWLSESI